MRRPRPSLFHLTYAEDQFGLLGQFGWPDRSKVIATFHQPPSHLPKWFPSDGALRHLDGAIAVASNQLETLGSLVGPERVFLVPHGVDTQFWSPNTGHPKRSDVPTILSVGHWLRDFELMHQVIRALRARYGSDVDVVIVTSADHARALRNWAGVRILVGISEAELRDWYRAADVMILPLIDGTVNNAMLEALACGTPVVGTEVGAIRDLADEVGILAVPPADPDAMTAGVISVLDDPAYHERSQFARQTSERYDWSRVAHDLIDVYRKLGGNGQLSANAR
jgi:glycosyltransferase involved in cell wall biosynthesis